MSFWAPPPLPKTKLGRYRVLSPQAGVRVSPLCLGGMNIGDKWAAAGMGSMDKESSFKLLDAFYDAGVRPSLNGGDEMLTTIKGKFHRHCLQLPRRII